MKEMQDDFEYGTGIEPLHHPQQTTGSEVDPSSGSSGNTRKGDTAVFKAGWHGAGPNPLDALDESAYFPNLYDGKTSKNLSDTRMSQSAWSRIQNDNTASYLEDANDLPTENDG